jgi:hypothetical protein
VTAAVADGRTVGCCRTWKEQTVERQRDCTVPYGSCCEPLLATTAPKSVTFDSCRRPTPVAGDSDIWNGHSSIHNKGSCDIIFDKNSLVT